MTTRSVVRHPASSSSVLQNSAAFSDEEEHHLKGMNPVEGHGNTSGPEWKRPDIHQFKASSYKGSVTSEKSSRLDPHTYQSYAAGLLYSSSRSERFLKLQKHFAVLERIAELDKASLPQSPSWVQWTELAKSGGGGGDFQSREELQELYCELQEAKRNKEFFHQMAKAEQFHWSPEKDFGLQKRAHNLRDQVFLYSNLVNEDKTPIVSHTLSSEIKKTLSFGTLYEKFGPSSPSQSAVKCSEVRAAREQPENNKGQQQAAATAHSHTKQAAATAYSHTDACYKNGQTEVFDRGAEPPPSFFHADASRQNKGKCLYFHNISINTSDSQKQTPRPPDTLANYKPQLTMLNKTNSTETCLSSSARSEASRKKVGLRAMKQDSFNFGNTFSTDGRRDFVPNLEDMSENEKHTESKTITEYIPGIISTGDAQAYIGGIVQGNNTTRQVSYLQHMENAAKKAKQRAIHGTHLDPPRNEYEVYVEEVKKMSKERIDASDLSPATPISCNSALQSATPTSCNSVLQSATPTSCNSVFQSATPTSSNSVLQSKASGLSSATPTSSNSVLQSKASGLSPATPTPCNSVCQSKASGLSSATPTSCNFVLQSKASGLSSATPTSCNSVCQSKASGLSPATPTPCNSVLQSKASGLSPATPTPCNFVLQSKASGLSSATPTSSNSVLQSKASGLSSATPTPCNSVCQSKASGLSSATPTSCNFVLQSKASGLSSATPTPCNSVCQSKASGLSPATPTSSNSVLQSKASGLSPATPTPCNSVLQSKASGLSSATPTSSNSVLQSKASGLSPACGNSVCQSKVQKKSVSGMEEHNSESRKESERKCHFHTEMITDMCGSGQVTFEIDEMCDANRQNTSTSLTGKQFCRPDSENNNDRWETSATGSRNSVNSSNSSMNNLAKMNCHTEQARQHCCRMPDIQHNYRNTTTTAENPPAEDIDSNSGSQSVLWGPPTLSITSTKMLRLAETVSQPTVKLRPSTVDAKGNVFCVRDLRNLATNNEFSTSSLAWMKRSAEVGGSGNFKLAQREKSQWIQGAGMSQISQTLEPYRCAETEEKNDNVILTEKSPVPSLTAVSVSVDSSTHWPTRGKQMALTAPPLSATMRQCQVRPASESHIKCRHTDFENIDSQRKGAFTLADSLQKVSEFRMTKGAEVVHASVAIVSPPLQRRTIVRTDSAQGLDSTPNRHNKQFESVNRHNKQFESVNRQSKQCEPGDEHNKQCEQLQKSTGATDIYKSWSPTLDTPSFPPNNNCSVSSTDTFIVKETDEEDNGQDDLESSASSVSRLRLMFEQRQKMNKSKSEPDLTTENRDPPRRSRFAKSHAAFSHIISSDLNQSLAHSERPGTETEQTHSADMSLKAWLLSNSRNKCDPYLPPEDILKEVSSAATGIKLDVPKKTVHRPSSVSRMTLAHYLDHIGSEWQQTGTAASFPQQLHQGHHLSSSASDRRILSHHYVNEDTNSPQTDDLKLQLVGVFRCPEDMQYQQHQSVRVSDYTLVQNNRFRPRFSQGSIKDPVTQPRSQPEDITTRPNTQPLNVPAAHVGYHSSETSNTSILQPKTRSSEIEHTKFDVSTDPENNTVLTVAAICADRQASEHQKIQIANSRRGFVRSFPPEPSRLPPQPPKSAQPLPASWQFEASRSEDSSEEHSGVYCVTTGSVCYGTAVEPPVPPLPQTYSLPASSTFPRNPAARQPLFQQPRQGSPSKPTLRTSSYSNTLGASTSVSSVPLPPTRGGSRGMQGARILSGTRNSLPQDSSLSAVEQLGVKSPPASAGFGSAVSTGYGGLKLALSAGAFRHQTSDARRPRPEPMDPEKERRRREEEEAYRRKRLEELNEEDRMRKLKKDEEDSRARRHHDHFMNSHKSPISPNRFDDTPPSLSPSYPVAQDLAQLSIPPERRRGFQIQGRARALFNFNAQNPRELSLRKNDVIYLLRQVDKNWFEGERHGRVGIFPTNYVEVVTSIEAAKAAAMQAEGQGRAKYTFTAQSSVELSLRKGEFVVLLRRVDENWFEGRIGNRQGIFPASYVEIIREPSTPLITPAPSVITTPMTGTPEMLSPVSYEAAPTPPPQPSPSAFMSQRSPTGPYGYRHTHTASLPRQEMSDLCAQDADFSISPAARLGSPGLGKKASSRPAVTTSPSSPLQVDIHSKAKRWMNGQARSDRVADDDLAVTRYRAVYAYHPQNEDELELREGDEIFVMEKCDDGWFVGTSARTGCFGTFPGNYVQKI